MLGQTDEPRALPELLPTERSEPVSRRENYRFMSPLC